MTPNLTHEISPFGGFFVITSPFSATRLFLQPISIWSCDHISGTLVFRHTGGRSPIHGCISRIPSGLCTIGRSYFTFLPSLRSKQAAIPPEPQTTSAPILPYPM